MLGELRQGWSATQFLCVHQWLHLAHLKIKITSSLDAGAYSLKAKLLNRGLWSSQQVVYQQTSERRRCSSSGRRWPPSSSGRSVPCSTGCLRSRQIPDHFVFCFVFHVVATWFTGDTSTTTTLSRGRFEVRASCIVVRPPILEQNTQVRL